MLFSKRLNVQIWNDLQDVLGTSRLTVNAWRPRPLLPKILTCKPKQTGLQHMKGMMMNIVALVSDVCIVGLAQHVELIPLSFRLL